MGGDPTEHRCRDGQADIAYFQWGSRDPDAPTVLLVHATGFHGRSWDRVIAALPEGYRVFAVDLRGHGRSARQGPYQWDNFGHDLEALVESLELRGAVAVGHSMGGHCVTQVAGSLPEAFGRLLLVDPVIFDPEAYLTDRYRGYDVAENHPVARRRNDWQSWQEMYQHFSERHPYSLWRPEVLEDYCRYGVLAKADGSGYELACPPLVEASVYLGNTQTDIHGLMSRISQPVTVLRAPPREPADPEVMDFSKSPTWPGLAAAFPNGRDVYLPHLTHFIPMQDPDLVARFIVDPDADP